MRFSSTIDLYIADMKAQSRLNSPRSEVAYRASLNRHAGDVSNRDPRLTGREDVKRTLAHWSHPNTQRRQRSMLVSFYDWMVEEGLRKDNPARQTRRPKPRPPKVYRLTLEETQRFVLAARSQRERWIAYLGVCAGPRLNELRQFQGRHFARAGWVWISEDIGKGGRERWVPVLPDLEAVIAEIQEHCDRNDWLFPAERWLNPGTNTARRPLERPTDSKTIWRAVKRIGERAGIAAPVAPHMLRRAFADHVTRGAGVRNAQILLGHADLGTTQGYLGQPTLDELQRAVAGLALELSPSEMAREPASRGDGDRTRGRDLSAARAISPVLEMLFASPGLRQAAREMAP